MLEVARDDVASLRPVPWGLVVGGGFYAGGAAALGLALIGRGAALLFQPSERRARGLFVASVVYLPALPGLLGASAT